MSSYPTAALTTDIIVGFPGETDKEFQGYPRLCQKSRVCADLRDIFRYSQREGTPAAEFKAQVPDQVKAARAEARGGRTYDMRHDFLKAADGKTARILIEQQEEDGLTAYTESYRPVCALSRSRVERNPL